MVSRISLEVELVVVVVVEHVPSLKVVATSFDCKLFETKNGLKTRTSRRYSVGIDNGRHSFGIVMVMESMIVGGMMRQISLVSRMSFDRSMTKSQ